MILQEQIILDHVFSFCWAADPMGLPLFCGKNPKKNNPGGTFCRKNRTKTPTQGSQTGTYEENTGQGSRLWMLPAVFATAGSARFTTMSRVAAKTRSVLLSMKSDRYPDTGSSVIRPRRHALRIGTTCRPHIIAAIRPRATTQPARRLTLRRKNRTFLMEIGNTS